MDKLNPMLNDGVYVFVSVPYGTEIAGISFIALFREKEGMTLIVEEEIALRQGWTILFRAAWITLSINSELEMVGLTAAVSAALTEENISCNVIAAAFHDHLFVPLDRASDAMRILAALQLAV